MKNLLFILLLIALTAIGIFAVPPVLRNFLGVEQPIMTVVSNSMWPQLSRGDIIFVTKAEDKDIKVGSVVVFRHEQGLAVHRVVELGDFLLTTKGDANVKEDNPIYYEDIVGRVPSIGTWLIKIPWFGHIALLANPQGTATEPGETTQVDFWSQLLRVVISPVGFIVFIGFPLLLIFWDLLADFMPMSARKRKMRIRAKRLQSRWGEERAKRMLKA